MRGKHPAWKACPAVDRFHNCRALLRICGFITDKENRQIAAKIKKWVEASTKKARP